MTAQDVALAEARAVAARAQLNGTVGQLQRELEPRRIARIALDEAVVGGERAARAGAEAARRNPGAVAGAAALLVAVLTRKRIAAILGKRRGRKTPPKPQHSAHPAERIGS